jgi:hypothetical protein
VTVPETAVNKNHGPVFGQYDIGFPGKFTVVDPESVTAAVKEAPD